MTRLALGFGAIGLLVLVGCVSRDADRAKGRVLSIFAGGDSGLRYELVIDPCVEKQCNLRVQLVRHGSVLDSKRLEWASSTSQLTAGPIEAGWGVGDVLGPTPGEQAWTGDVEETGFITAARLVALGRGRTGMLVTQRSGVEPGKRWHALFVVDADRLVTAWSKKEGDGPTWSSTDVLPLGAGSQQILFADGYQAGSAGTDQPDRLDFTSLSWNPARGQLDERPASEVLPLEIVSFGNFATVAKANAARTSCLARFWILDAAPFEGLPSHGYFVGAITSDSSRAQDALASARQCSPPLRGSILPYKKRG